MSTQADLSTYADAASISNYAREAMAWANKAGLINGNSAGYLTPANNATRAQVAAILARFCQNIVHLEDNTGSTTPGTTPGSGSGSGSSSVSPAPDSGISGSELTAEAEKTSYAITESNTISGYLKQYGSALSGHSVTMTIYFGTARVMADQTTTASDGSYSFTFTLPESCTAGAYSARIRVGAPVDQTKTVNFAVVGENTVDRTALKAAIDNAESKTESMNLCDP